MMRDLSWFECGRGATSEEVGDLQSELGITFPPDVVTFLEKHAGASNPKECEFPMNDPFGYYNSGSFGAVLDVHQGSTDGIRAANNEIEGLPPNAIHLIATGDGDYICLYYLAIVPVIAYYFHGRLNGENILFLTQTFSQFLRSLRVPEDGRDLL